MSWLIQWWVTTESNPGCLGSVPTQLYPMWRVHPLVEYTFTGVYRYSISVDNRFDNPIDNTIEISRLYYLLLFCHTTCSNITPHQLHRFMSIFYKISIIFNIRNRECTDARGFKIIIDWFCTDAQTHILSELI